MCLRQRGEEFAEVHTHAGTQPQADCRVQAPKHPLPGPSTTSHPHQLLKPDSFLSHFHPSPHPPHCPDFHSCLWAAGRGTVLVPWDWGRDAGWRSWGWRGPVHILIHSLPAGGLAEPGTWRVGDRGRSRRGLGLQALIKSVN